MDERIPSFPNRPTYVTFGPPPPSTSSGGGPGFIYSPHHGPPNHLPPSHHHQLPPPADYGFPPPHLARPLSPTPITPIHHQHALSSNVSFHHHHQQRLGDPPSHHLNHHPPPPVDERAHLGRSYELDHNPQQQNRTGRTEDFFLRVSNAVDVLNHGERRSPPRLPKFDSHSIRSDSGPSFRDLVAAPIRQRLGLDREAHHRYHNEGRISPPFVRLDEHRNQLEREFVRAGELRLDQRFRETDMVVRNEKDNGGRFFCPENGREGSQQSQLGSGRDMIRPPRKTRWDQSSRNRIRSVIEVADRVVDSRDGYSELSERGKARVIDSGRYCNKDRPEVAHDHSHSPKTRFDRKVPYHRMEQDRPSVRSRNDSTSTTRRARFKETVEYQHRSSRRDRESSPVVSSELNSLNVGSSVSSPDDLKKINKPLPESCDQLAPVDSTGKQFQLKSVVQICCENELSSIEAEKTCCENELSSIEPKVPFNMKEAIPVPIEESILWGASPKPVSMKIYNSSGNENHLSPKLKDSGEDNTCPSSEKVLSPNIGKRRKHMTYLASPSSPGKEDTACNSVDNASAIDCAGHIGDHNEVNKSLPQSSDQLLPVDSAIEQCERGSGSEICCENELFAMEEEEKSKASFITKEASSAEKNIFCDANLDPVPCDTDFSSDNKDQSHSSQCKDSDKDSTSSGSGKESSLYIGKKRKLTTPSSSLDSGKRVRKPSLRVNDAIVIDCSSVGEDQYVANLSGPTSEKEGENCLNKAIIEPPSALQDKEGVVDSAFAASSISHVKERIISLPFQSSSENIGCSSGTGETMDMNFDECGGSLDYSDRCESVMHQDVGSLLVDPGSSVNSMEGHVTPANSADSVMLVSNSRTVSKRAAEESERPGGMKLTKCTDSEVQVASMPRDIKIPLEEGLPSGSGCVPEHVHSTCDDDAVTKSPNNCISESVSISQSSFEMSVTPKADKVCEKNVLFPDKSSDKRLVIVLPSISKCNVVSSADGLKADGPTERKQDLSGKMARLPPLPLITSKTTQSSDEVSMNQMIGRNNETKCVSAKVMSDRLTFIAPSNRKPTVHSMKPRIWHRANGLPHAQPTSKKFDAISQPVQKPNHILGVKAQNSSYIRKGNSLVRNPASASSERSPALTTSVNKLNSFSFPLKVAPTVMSKASPSPCISGSSNSGFIPPGYIRSSTSLDSLVVAETDSHRSSESLSTSLKNSDSDINKKFEVNSLLSDANQSTSDVNTVVYLKQKSNQLVAAPKHSAAPIESVDGSNLSSKVYYKMKKNQLVRAPETHTQLNSAPADCSNSNQQRILKPYSCKSTSKRQVNKVRKTFGAQKLSLVWTLCGAQSQKKVSNSLKCGNVLPHLLPWKRVTYIAKSPSSFFSQKLLSSKRRNIIYTRFGLSLRRSKVVGVAGCNLKWSNSLEKRSKKTEREACLAIRTMKKGKKSMDAGATIGKSRNNVSCERIYRIGNFRYKMDPSRRTLLRIPDEESSSMAAGQHTEILKSCAVPKRLHIGHDEYVRIGNGNQLVRNPKRRTRIIASERVRWSLHTVRMRMAKKRKYCQFFTRFGKCNKAEGKCPYIHDASKVAVCTKFLNGSCFDPDCKLTHKVMPERMPDCSYYLQGLCSNENCPYRHVNVNPKAAICGNFLKGYCDEGDECRKKHSYICPAFEVKGECQEGSKCKLYHRKKGKYNGKSRVLKQYQKSSWGRYFDSGITALAESGEKVVTTVAALQCMPKGSGENMTVEDGSLSDFISLEGYSDVEEEESDHLTAKLADSPHRGDKSRLQLDDMEDEPVKPIRLLG